MFRYCVIYSVRSFVRSLFISFSSSLFLWLCRAFLSSLLLYVCSVVVLSLFLYVVSYVFS